MTNEEVKSKPKKVKKPKKETEVKKVKKETEAKKVKKLKKETEAVGDKSCAAGAQSYVAGEIAGSLFSGTKSSQKSSTLSSLFDAKTSAVQPLYVPVVLTKPKRKLPEPEDTKGDKTTAVTDKSAEKEPKKSKKELTVAEKKLAARESALTNADDDEKIGKVKKVNKSADDDDELPLHIKKRRIKTVEKAKNKRTVFVGNLPASCTKQMLKACFKEFGHIESMRFRSMAREDSSLSKKVATIQRKIHPKRKNINAYVLFKEQESASKALVRNGLEISSGFHIRVDLASKNSSHDNKKSAFVGNLPYDIEEEALRNHFSDCGAVEGVRIIRDQKTGIGKGFGYILFKGADAVQLALKLNNSELTGRKIRVKHCVTGGTQNAQKDSAIKGKSQTPGKLKKKSSFVGKTANAAKSTGKLKKKSSFVGETADAAKSKTKRPKNKKKKPMK